MKVEYSWSWHDANGVFRYGDRAQRSPMELVTSYWHTYQDLQVREPAGELVAYIETKADGTRGYWVKDQQQKGK